MKRKLTYNKSQWIRPSVINNPSKSINVRWSIEKWELTPTDFDEESEKWDNRELGCDESYVKLSDDLVSLLHGLSTDEGQKIIQEEIDKEIIEMIKKQGFYK